MVVFKDSKPFLIIIRRDVPHEYVFLFYLKSNQTVYIFAHGSCPRFLLGYLKYVFFYDICSLENVLLSNLLISTTVVSAFVFINSPSVS